MLWLPLTAAIFLIAGIALGSYISTTDTNLGARHKLNQVFDIISENYVDEVSADSLVEMALPELLKTLTRTQLIFRAASVWLSTATLKALSSASEYSSR